MNILILSSPFYPNITQCNQVLVVDADVNMDVGPPLLQLEKATRGRVGVCAGSILISSRVGD